MKLKVLSFRLVYPLRGRQEFIQTKTPKFWFGGGCTLRVSVLKVKISANRVPMFKLCLETFIPKDLFIWEKVSHPLNICLCLSHLFRPSFLTVITVIGVWRQWELGFQLILTWRVCKTYDLISSSSFSSLLQAFIWENIIPFQWDPNSRRVWSLLTGMARFPSKHNMKITRDHIGRWDLTFQFTAWKVKWFLQNKHALIKLLTDIFTIHFWISAAHFLCHSQPDPLTFFTHSVYRLFLGRLFSQPVSAYWTLLALPLSCVRYHCWKEEALMHLLSSIRRPGRYQLRKKTNCYQLRPTNKREILTASFYWGIFTMVEIAKIVWLMKMIFLLIVILKIKFTLIQMITSRKNRLIWRNLGQSERSSMLPRNLYYLQTVKLRRIFLLIQTVEDKEVS